MLSLFGKLLSCYLLIFFFSSLVAANEPDPKIEITLGTFVYSPLMYEKNDPLGRQGIGIDVIKKAFLSSDKFKLKVVIYPIKRSMMELKRDRIDLFLGSRLDFPNIKDEIIAVKLLTLKSVLFCLPKHCNTVNIQGNTKNLGSIASIPGSPVNEQLRASGNEIYLLQTLKKSFRFLAMKRALFVAAIDFAGLETLQNLDKTERKDIEHTNFSLLEIPYDLVVKNNHPHAKEISDLVKSSIQSSKLQTESSLLVKKYLSGEVLFN